MKKQLFVGYTSIPLLKALLVSHTFGKGIGNGLDMLAKYKIKQAERIDKYSAIGALGLYILSFIFIISI